MNKNSVVLAILGVVVLVLIGGGILMRHQLKTEMNKLLGRTEEVTEVKEEAPVPTSAEITQTVVEFTDQGFVPAMVTVKKGATVKFVNKSAGKMDVASNPHPTHTDYPGFDQYKSDARGKDEYDFTFDKTGSWGYHNHLNPTLKGTVVVTE